MAVKGVFASDSNIQGTRKGDFAGSLLQTVPTGSAPMLALSAGMKSRGMQDTVITWFEENHLSGRNTVTNNATTGATFTLSDATQVVANQVYLIETTGEYVFVESITGSNATVKRGLGGTTVTSIDGSGTPVPIQRISTAFEEGSSRPTAVANIGFPRFNYRQIFRNSWDVTGSARVIEYHTGNIVAKNRRDALLFHSEDIERSILWGVKTMGVLNSKPFSMMDGIVTMFSTNVSAQSTNVTWTDIDAFLQNIFEINIKGQPNERIAFCGNSVVGVLNRIAALESTINIEPGETEFGMKIRRWMTPYGDITLMTHPLMNESPHFTKDLIVIHPAAVEIRYMRKTHEDAYDADGRRAGVDADYGVYTTEMSLSYMAEATGGVYTGIDTAAAGA